MHQLVDYIRKNPQLSKSAKSKIIELIDKQDMIKIDCIASKKKSLEKLLAWSIENSKLDYMSSNKFRAFN